MFRVSLDLGAVELDGSYEVAAGVFEKEQVAYVGDGGAFEDDLCVVLAEQGFGLVERGDRDGAFEAVGLDAGDEGTALLEGAHEGDGFGAGIDLVEAWRAVGEELPAEDGFVEGSGGFDVVGVDGEVGEMVHVLQGRPKGVGQEDDILKRNVGEATT